MGAVICPHIKKGYMREETIRKDNRAGLPPEIAIVEKIRYYPFQNLLPNRFFLNNICFEPNGTDGDTKEVLEGDRRTAMSSKYVERGFLVELDDEGNPMSSIDRKGDEHHPITNKFLLEKMKSKGKGLHTYLESVSDSNTLNRMKKLCLEKKLTTDKYVKIQARIEQLDG